MSSAVCLDRLLRGCCRCSRSSTSVRLLLVLALCCAQCLTVRQSRGERRFSVFAVAVTVVVVVVVAAAARLQSLEEGLVTARHEAWVAAGVVLMRLQKELPQ